MSFYNDWFDSFERSENCNNYIKEFLVKKDSSVVALDNGEITELDAAFTVLTSTPTKSFLNVLLTLKTERKLLSNEVPQFSSFEDGAIRIPELLEFYPEGENFIDLGYQMVSAKNEAANRKYGENHSRLAEMLGLVKITTSKPRYVINTAWGKYLVKYSSNDKSEVFKRLLLREYFIQVFLKSAFQTRVSYFDLVSFLSETTAMRRRSNTKRLMEFLLTDTDWECYLKNIIWQ